MKTNFDNNKGLIATLIISTVSIIILLITLLYISNSKCPEIKQIAPTKPKTQTVPVEQLIKDLQEKENFTINLENKPTEAEIQKDRQLLIFLLQEHLEKQKKEGNNNPYISINDLKLEIKSSLKNSQEILEILDNTIKNIQITTQSPMMTTTSPPMMN